MSNVYTFIPDFPSLFFEIIPGLSTTNHAFKDFQCFGFRKLQFRDFQECMGTMGLSQVITEISPTD